MSQGQNPNQSQSRPQQPTTTQPYIPQTYNYGMQDGYTGGYSYPMYNQMQQYPYAQQQQPSMTATPGMLPMEESYIENILRLNKGKTATVYMTFENNDRWNAKIFKGIIEAAGRDHIILSDPETGKRYILLMVYLDYITFDEEIVYEYPYGAQTANYTPR
ncbi:spore coat protein GerQ [Gracilibacillus salinarum]|uniref:Spore coat protein GerQ n=1 Tax=Gracilibacillus salinarum TaxID=2932255 RepID=A0ABY4GRU5_9BACI|nr:spore coat protein GerQ [Gracilibacillus salinarum]UOQ87116.1 spore coat protein GerQ [Gracilibacillus salinarum]